MATPKNDIGDFSDEFIDAFNLLIEEFGQNLTPLAQLGKSFFWRTSRAQPRDSESVDIDPNRHWGSIGGRLQLMGCMEAC